MKVAIIFGSKSDTEVMRGAADALRKFDIPCKAYVLSAHRAFDKLMETIKLLEKEDCELIIAGAGLSAHLPGVIAANTLIPVIGVPINVSLSGLDALFSIVQMPKEVPVAAVGINNSYNAGILAVRILSIKYKELREKLLAYKDDLKEKFLKDNEVIL